MAPFPNVSALVEPAGPLLRLIDWLQKRFFPEALDDVTARWVACAIIIVVAVLLRRVVAAIIFSPLKRVSRNARNKLIVPSLEAPTATLLMLCGLIAAISVVPLWETLPNAVWLGERGALTAVVLWGVACVGGAMIDLSLIHI